MFLSQTKNYLLRLRGFAFRSLTSLRISRRHPHPEPLRNATRLLPNPLFGFCFAPFIYKHEQRYHDYRYYATNYEHLELHCLLHMAIINGCRLSNNITFFALLLAHVVGFIST